MEIIYRIQFTEVADEDIVKWKHSGNISAMKKISRLLNELEQHPCFGTGKPEELKHEFAGF